VIEDEKGSQSWVIDGNVPFSTLGATAVRVDGTKIEGVGVERNDRFDKMSKAAYDVDARLGFLDEHGIYAQVVFPNVSGFGNQRFMQIDDSELRLACATIYNDHMADIQKQSGQRLFPQALVPFWDIDQAIAEVKRARNQLGLTGIVMCDSPQDFDLPSLDMPEWDPFWSLCEDLNVAVNFHIGSGDMAEGLLKNRVATYGEMAAFAEEGHVGHRTLWELGRSRIVDDLVAVIEADAGALTWAQRNIAEHGGTRQRGRGRLEHQRRQSARRQMAQVGHRQVAQLRSRRVEINTWMEKYFDHAHPRQ